MRATGVTSLTVCSSWCPTSQPIHPGRRTSTVSVTGVPAARRAWGQTIPWLSPIGNGLPSGPFTDTPCTSPEKPGRETVARPVVDEATPAVGQARSAATAAPCDENDGERRQDPDAHHHNFSMSYAPAGMNVPDAGRGARGSCPAARSTSSSADSGSLASAATPTA